MRLPALSQPLRRLLARLHRRDRAAESLAPKLAEVLRRPHADRDAPAFLRRHDYLVGMALGRSESPRGVVPDFKPGTATACDFLVVGCAPGWWDFTFVHLDSPKARLHQVNGHPTQALRVAQERLAQWTTWAAAQNAGLRRTLAVALAQLDMPASPAHPRSSAALELTNPDCALSCQCCIVLGRRDTQASPPRRSRRREPSPAAASLIATYDDFLDAAQRFDQADALQQQSHRFWKG